MLRFQTEDPAVSPCSAPGRRRHRTAAGRLVTAAAETALLVVLVIVCAGPGPRPRRRWRPDRRPPPRRPPSGPSWSTWTATTTSSGGSPTISTPSSPPSAPAPRCRWWRSPTAAGDPIAADGGWTGARVFHVTEGMKATAENAVADWGQIDMGSPQTLVDLITWTRANYPARHYALYFWDHGWGWWPGYTMHDVTSNDTLDMDEIRDAMQRTAGVDMVGMDTCMGQMIEVEATFRGFARAIAASEDAIGYTGVRVRRGAPQTSGAPDDERLRPRRECPRRATGPATTSGRSRARRWPWTGAGTG